MKVGRTLPPAAAHLCLRDLWHGLAGIVDAEPPIRALEDELRRDFGTRHVFLVSSGTAALSLTLQALRSLSPRSDVVLPAYTCFSVPAAVVHAGLRPVLCDVNPATFDFDHALLQRTIGPDTLCVIAHHLFGVPSDIAGIRALCAARGIYLVEDAAQAMGVDAGGRRLGTFGDAGIFSLGRGKNITCGSGGIIVTNSSDIGEAIARRHRVLPAPSRAAVVRDLLGIVLMMIFIRPRLVWIPAALPFLRLGETIFPKKIRLRRLSGMQAGLLRNWRRRLTQSNRIRSQAAVYFSRCLPAATAERRPGPYLRLPILAPTATDRARIYARSRARGLGISLAYPTPVNEIPELKPAFDGQQFPAAGRIAETLLTLPTHRWVSERDKRAIAVLCRGLADA